MDGITRGTFNNSSAAIRENNLSEPNLPQANST